MTNKVSGYGADFALVKKEGNRTIIGYEKKAVEGSDLYVWYEVYFYKSIPTIQQVKDAVFNDINSQTDNEILCGLDYTIKHGADQGKQVKLWLSDANQNNIHAQCSAGTIFPWRYKVAEDNGAPVYEEFADATELSTVSDMITNYVHQCQEDGWARKDAIDWGPYVDALEHLTPNE